MDGRELLRTMRQAKVVPILVLTGILSLEDEIELLSLGATVCNSSRLTCAAVLLRLMHSSRLYNGVGTYREAILYLDLWTELVINPLHRQVHLKERRYSLLGESLICCTCRPAVLDKYFHESSSTAISGMLTQSSA